MLMAISRGSPFHLGPLRNFHLFGAQPPVAGHVGAPYIADIPQMPVHVLKRYGKGG